MVSWPGHRWLVRAGCVDCALWLHALHGILHRDQGLRVFNRRNTANLDRKGTWPSEQLAGKATAAGWEDGTEPVVQASESRGFLPGAQICLGPVGLPSAFPF